MSSAASASNGARVGVLLSSDLNTGRRWQWSALLGARSAFGAPLFCSPSTRCVRSAGLPIVLAWCPVDAGARRGRARVPAPTKRALIDQEHSRSRESDTLAPPGFARVANDAG